MAGDLQNSTTGCGAARTGTQLSPHQIVVHENLSRNIQECISISPRVANASFKKILKSSEFPERIFPK